MIIVTCMLISNQSKCVTQSISKLLFSLYLNYQHCHTQTLLASIVLQINHTNYFNRLILLYLTKEHIWSNNSLFVGIYLFSSPTKPRSISVILLSPLHPASFFFLTSYIFFSLASFSPHVQIQGTGIDRHISQTHPLQLI